MGALNFAAVRPITTKFGRQMQNDMPMTTHKSLKIETGGRILIWQLSVFVKRK